MRQRQKQGVRQDPDGDPGSWNTPGCRESLTAKVTYQVLGFLGKNACNFHQISKGARNQKRLRLPSSLEPTRFCHYLRITPHNNTTSHFKGPLSLMDQTSRSFQKQPVSIHCQWLGIHSFYDTFSLHLTLEGMFKHTSSHSLLQ